MSKGRRRREEEELEGGGQLRALTSERRLRRGRKTYISWSRAKPIAVPESTDILERAKPKKSLMQLGEKLQKANELELTFRFLPLPFVCLPIDTHQHQTPSSIFGLASPIVETASFFDLKPVSSRINKSRTGLERRLSSPSSRRPLPSSLLSTAASLRASRGDHRKVHET